MTDTSKLLAQHMLVVFFIYGLAFVLFGTAILLKDDKKTRLRLRRVLWLLGAFGLLHGLSEWSDMFLSLGEAYWSPLLFGIMKLIGFYLGLSSFVFLLVFGVRAVAVDGMWFKWLERGSLSAALLFVFLVSWFGTWSHVSTGWYATAGLLMRYLLAFPSSLLAAAGFYRQSYSREVRSIYPYAVFRNMRWMSAVFIAYAVLAGIVVPKAPFPPALFINYDSFQKVFGIPVQVFRAVCSLSAAWFILAILNAFSIASYGELEKQVEERTSDLKSANEALRQDIAARKRVEAELEESRDAALESSRSKSEFLANMSHEIRTPMNGILGMTELVLGTKLDSEQREYLNMARVSADSLLSVINDILDYSKIEAGKLEIENVEFDLRDKLTDAMKVLGVSAQQKELELICDIASDVPCEVVGDPGRLRQILVNLVGNAIKFTAKGEVIFSVRMDSRTEDEVQIHFTVADTGIGIPLQKQTAIFEAFTQADGSMTRTYGGTGLGLTISARLVASMRGRIWVESEPGRGSRFHFTAVFPLPRLPARTTAPADPTILCNMRVLVVDDNATNREILVGILENWQADPTAVETGAEAISALQDGQRSGISYPLILIDAHMPGMDGFAVIEEIQRNPRWSSATIMMLSSAGQMGDAGRCRELGVSAYLTKPVQRTELLEAILASLATRPIKQSIPVSAARHARLEATRRLSILLVEDNAVNRALAVRLFEQCGHSVTVALNRKEALATLDRQTFDLIFMDVQMPDMDGLEATRAIRENEKGSGTHVPIIAMTAHAMAGDEERFRRAGMDEYVSKPVKSEELTALLKRYASVSLSIKTD
jgi:signal transduction histidine kinase/DNA-binding response OmpR family regulator